MEFGYGKELFINLIHYPVYSLGIGKRIGIWFQGCSIGCKDCISNNTWKQENKHKKTIEDISLELKNYVSIVDGISISGGEPFQQPEGLYKLLIELKNNNYEDILVYSGYDFSYLQQNFPAHLELIAVLIDGKFITGLETEFNWKGSENQNMNILTKNHSLKEKYMEYKVLKNEPRKLQIVEKNHDIYVLGIPKQKDAGAIKNGFL